MRTYSTPESALNGEITKLAIIECVVSAAIYVGTGVYFGTFKYLALAVVVAPLMLFRTEFSADWGLHLYKQFTNRSQDFLEQFPAPWSLLPITLFFIAIPITGTAIRVVATVYWACRRPIQTLRDTPRNWLRQCFCTDLAHPPEIVPKEAIAEEADVIKFATVTEEYRLEKFREEDKLLHLLFLIVLSPLYLLGWMPSFIYRVSFKATALAYTPFIFVAHATLRNPLPVKARLERITKGELEKVRRGFSWIVLATLVAKLALMFSWVDRSFIESKFPSQKIVTNFVVLDGWPWWQITLGADAVLTFILLFFADAALARIEGQKPWREETVMTIVTSISFLRAVFSVATISHFFYIALLAAAPESLRHLLTI